MKGKKSLSPDGKENGVKKNCNKLGNLGYYF